MPPKKKHHYVPVAYLKAFCVEDGKLWVYRKDAPEAPFRSGPDEVALQNYYYAQPLLGGGRDTDRVENRFSSLETKWPPLVARISARECINADLEDLFAFVALQRARVPSARDAFERMLAGQVMATTRMLDRQGKLPPAPKGLEKYLDRIQVAIDPHQSIIAMVPMIQAMGLILDQLGFVVLHNETNVDFLTSDNPVAYYDPALQGDALLPYTLPENGGAELMMPISPRLLLYGNSLDKQRFAQRGLEYFRLVDVERVAAMNETIVRFGYEAIFANSNAVTELVKKHAALSPTLEVAHVATHKSQLVLYQNVFGTRERKPKWTGRPS
jgi:hypothetical protein